MIDTTETVFVVSTQTVLEESGSSSLFSLFRKNLEAHCFHCFGRIWKLITVFAVLEESGSSLFSQFCNTFWMFCWGVSQKTVPNNELLDSSETVKRVIEQWEDEWKQICGLNHSVIITLYL